ncbi:MAG: hypothetical protein GEV12_22655 [Micromonosporaceae bacterium]|nr:hypothetical protein [Micromonosporaceae bacterium]
MRIRLHGTPGGRQTLAGRLATVCRVVAVSPPYADRRGGGLVRVYLDVRLPDQPDQADQADQHDRTRDRSKGGTS